MENPGTTVSQSRSFSTVFLIEMWERFGFYGMQVLMVTYMMKKLGFIDTRANLVWGAAAALIYATPAVGGWIGDKLIGTRRTMRIGAVVLTFPVLALQLYRFVAPGLYRRERNAFLPFLMASPVLFLMGAALVYFVMLPFVLWFSLNQQITGNAAISVQLLPKVSDYLSLVITLLLGFGLCFQLPVILALMGMVGMVSSKLLRSGRRYAILAVFVVAAVITPPDPISMMSLVIPGLALYEVSILCVWLIERRRVRDEAAEAAS